MLLVFVKNFVMKNVEYFENIFFYKCVQFIYVYTLNTCFLVFVKLFVMKNVEYFENIFLLENFRFSLHVYKPNTYF